MAKQVLNQAQIVLDDFYQSFAPANSFFTIDDVALKIVDERDSELEREFLIQYQLNKTNFPIINPNWLQNVFVDVKKDEAGAWYGLVCEPLFEFPFDEWGCAIQSVVPNGNNCAQFVRIGHSQTWQVCMTATSQMNFFSIEGCRINFHNFYGCCDKLMVTIVPSQSGLPMESQTVPDGKAASIREVVLNKMFRDYQAKFGKISAHNNGNPNSEPNETGLIYDQLKTK